MFDAYTVKKVLPRLAIAIVLIQLSWFIFTGLIQITNLVAWSIEGLIYIPFAEGTQSGREVLRLDNLLTSIGGGDGDVGTGFAGIFVGVVAVGGAVAASGGLIALALIAIIGVAIGFFVLTVRKIMLIVMLVIAPIALVAWILPGTERFWKMWWDNFSKLLLMYPIILAMVAAGKAFASIAGAQADNVLIEATIVLLAFTAPFFLIPKTFQWAGAGFAAVSGAVTGRAGRLASGISARGRKRQGERWKERGQRAGDGNYFKGGSATNMRGRFNRALQTGTLAGAGGLTLNARKRRARMVTARDQRDMDNAKKFMEENQTMAAIKGDDDKMWAMMNADNEEGVRKELTNRAKERFADPVALDNAVAEVMRAKREGGARTTRIASTLAQFGTGTGYNYGEEGKDDDAMDAVMRVAGDNNGLAGQIFAQGRQLASQSGRTDLAGGGFAKTMQYYEKRRTAEKGGPAYSAKDARKDVMKDVLQSNAGAAVAGKLEGVKQMVPVMKELADEALGSGDTKSAARELAKIAGRYEAAGQIAPQNAEALADGLMSQTIDVTALPDSTRMMLSANGDGTYDPNVKELTYQQAIERMRTVDPEFANMRRDFQNASTAAAAQAGQQQAEGNIPDIPTAPTT